MEFGNLPRISRILINGFRKGFSIQEKRSCTILSMVLISMNRKSRWRKRLKRKQWTNTSESQ